MQTQQQQHGGDRNVTGNSISANSLPSSPKYPIRIFRKTKMPMARNVEAKKSMMREDLGTNRARTQHKDITGNKVRMKMTYFLLGPCGWTLKKNHNSST